MIQDQLTCQDNGSDSFTKTESQMMAESVNNVFFAEALFEALPDVTFYIKNMEGRYLLVNRALALRCGFRDKSKMIGLTPADVFGTRLGASYMEQDREVLSSGVQIHDLLELHIYPNRATGWCLTYKNPLRDANNRIIGLAGISRDLAMPDQNRSVYNRIAAATKLIQESYGEQIQASHLEEITQLSISQIERYFRKIFNLTPHQLISKTRMEAAIKMLLGQSTITEVAIACGYQDHSAFTRQFKASVGITPSAYRALNKT